MSDLSEFAFNHESRNLTCTNRLFLTSIMNVEQFIARRIGSSSGRSFSGIIVKIAIAAIALSMMVMIITTNVITGFKNEISDKIFSFWGHIHIADTNVGDSFELIPIKKDVVFIDSLFNLRQIEYSRAVDFNSADASPTLERSMGGVSDVVPYTIVPCIIANKTDFEGLLLKGLDESYNEERIAQFLQDGQFITFSDSSASRDMVISQWTSDRMNLQRGDRINVNFLLNENSFKRQFRISGIYKTGLQEYDKRFAIVDMAILQELLDWDRDEISGLEVFVEHLDDLDLLNDYIYYEMLPPAIYSETVKNKFFQIFEWLELQNINERVIIILMIIVALINMVTALLIFVLERTNMIGILKALGSTNWSVRKIFMINAFQIIAKGIVIGNLLAVAFCLLQKFTGILKLDEADYYLSEVPIEFNLTSMIIINLATIIVVFVFMLIPSLVVTQIDPVKTIQFK